MYYMHPGYRTSIFVNSCILHIITAAIQMQDYAYQLLWVENYIIPTAALCITN